MNLKYKNGFYVSEDEHGETVLVSQKNLGECIEYINRFNISRVQISDMHYKLEDINFLGECENITHLMLDNMFLKDVSSVYNLKNLKDLAIVDSNYVLELDRVKNLENLSMYCDKKITGLQEMCTLKSLSLWKYNPKNRDLKELGKLRGLEYFKITQSKIDSLSGIESFGNLKSLQLYYLRTLKSLESLKYTSGKLTSLEIEMCKNIEKFCSIQYLESLEVLRLLDCGDIPTIDFIKNLKELNCFSFVGSTVVDGDLSFCEGIEYVSFTDKKHYSHKKLSFNKV
ncbi:MULTISPECIES: hypothetical protein [Bacillus]|uniref:Leucine-rich repeat domain-containing protein n=1 Tax=Bacillus cereus VD048 TaxID=1053226 RepID=J8H9S7_BACCE|nr:MULTISPECIES: hypothetical protein [Bacillus]EEK74510.1 hypothetical protein bcere0007_10140 [Bacillus mycoides]EJR29847.1 hypothetical protein IIG_03739 [Bacillus cereus VD048]MBK5425942.1 hypothetical protein [Bacillus sp. TH30]WJE35875.1 hypothetical protein QRX95_05850 [Bacillus mycoides]WOA64588.1 hypothetical protein RVY75_05775 [Bacillus mycoides]